MKHLTVLLLLLIAYATVMALGSEIYESLYPKAKLSLSHHAKTKTK